MPVYRARRFSNARAEKRYKFSASDPAAAKRIVLETLDWGTVSICAFEAADMEGEDVLIDLAMVNDAGEEWEILDGERIAESRPYSWDCIAFTQRVAALAEEGTYDNALDTLDHVIEEALALAGGEENRSLRPLHNLDSRSLATILAALRYWQREGLYSAGHEMEAIATDGGMFPPLSRAEIDALCLQINPGG